MCIRDSAKGMLVAHNVAAYFCEEHNPMYDAKRAAAELSLIHI